MGLVYIRGFDGDIVEYIYWPSCGTYNRAYYAGGQICNRGGIGNLPSDANGQVSGAVKGLTATNVVKNGDFKKRNDKLECTY